MPCSCRHRDRKHQRYLHLGRDRDRHLADGSDQSYFRVRRLDVHQRQRQRHRDADRHRHLDRLDAGRSRRGVLPDQDHRDAERLGVLSQDAVCPDEEDQVEVRLGEELSYCHRRLQRGAPCLD